MNRCLGLKALRVALFSLVLAEIASASPDPKLLSLIPQGALLVAGVSASSRPNQPNNFLLLTHDNQMDLADFYALVGSDSRRSIHQMVFVKLGDLDHSEHSLLVSGDFDRERLLHSAINAGGRVTTFHGIEVAELQPFDREKGEFDQLRWLAIPNPSVLIFGSIASVEAEIDRYLGQSLPDGTLIRQLRRLRSKDQTWCVLSARVEDLTPPAFQREIHQALAFVSSELADKAMSAEEFEFGLFYGGKVEFEYFLSRASRGPDKFRIDPSERSPFQPVQRTALLPALNPARQAHEVHDVIAIPIPRFDEWLATISNWH